MSDKPNLQFIMEKLGAGNGPGAFAFWACRGEGRGCARNKYRSRKKHCDDCVPAHDPNETLGALQERLKRGDS